MANTKLNSWAKQVVTTLRSKNGELFQQAIDAVQEDYDSPGPTKPLEQLEWMRGDEPQDCYENGDTAEQYADFLLEEWKLFGPRGE